MDFAVAVGAEDDALADLGLDAVESDPSVCHLEDRGFFHRWIEVVKVQDDGFRFAAGDTRMRRLVGNDPLLCPLAAGVAPGVLLSGVAAGAVEFPLAGFAAAGQTVFLAHVGAVLVEGLVNFTAAASAFHV